MATLARIRTLVDGAVRAPEETIHGATPDELVALESRLHQHLPPQLREFLTVCNGARIGPGGFFGQCQDDLSRDLPAVLASWPEWAPKGWLPVAGDGCGNYYVMTADGEIGFVDTMADPDVLELGRFSDFYACVESLLIDDQAAAE